MQTCLITTVSMTLALKGKGILEKNGVSAAVSRLPPKLTAAGCAWGISVDCGQARRAKELLDGAGLRYGKIVFRDGSPVLSPQENPVGITGTPRTTVSPKGGERR